MEGISVDPTPTISSFGRFPEFCMLSNSVSACIQGSNEAHNSCLCIGLATSGKLYLTQDPTSSHILHSHVTSFTVTSTFLIFVTNSHEAVFAPLQKLESITSEADVKDITSGWEKRKVERGSRIITAVPSTMSLVLQMPRGNLETINPRPLVMEVIKQDLDM
jgi:elongator complex protein 1